MGKDLIEDIKNDIGGDKVNDWVEFSLTIINFLLFLFKVLNKDFFIYFLRIFCLNQWVII